MDKSIGKVEILGGLSAQPHPQPSIPGIAVMRYKVGRPES
jgi:hypothetical protein